MEIRRKHIWTVMLCLYIAAVAYLCFARPDELPEIRPDIFGIPIDKLAHFLMFFPFPIVAYGSFKPKAQNKFIHLAVLFILYAAGMGLTIGTEHVQGQLGYRSEDVKDFYADLVGMSCSALLTAVYIIIKKL